KNARLKYTIDNRGLDWFVDELNSRLGYSLEPVRSFNFTTNGDTYGWTEGHNGKLFYTLFVEHGRVKDKKGYTLKTAIREIAKQVDCDLRLTENQNLINGNVDKSALLAIEGILIEQDVLIYPQNTGLCLNSTACVALGTYG